MRKESRPAAQRARYLSLPFDLQQSCL